MEKARKMLDYWFNDATSALWFIFLASLVTASGAGLAIYQAAEKAHQKTAEETKVAEAKQLVDARRAEISALLLERAAGSEALGKTNAVAVEFREPFLVNGRKFIADLTAELSAKLTPAELADVLAMEPTSMGFVGSPVVSDMKLHLLSIAKKLRALALKYGA